MNATTPETDTTRHGLPLVLDEKQTREILKISKTTLWRIERAGLLKSIAGVRKKRFATSAVLRYIDSAAA